MGRDMSKEFTIRIEAGCRIAGYISDKAKNKKIAEVFDVLEVTAEGQLRCHMVGTRFDNGNRHIFLEEDQLRWCRLSDGREFFRESSDDKWQDIKLIG